MIESNIFSKYENKYLNGDNIFLLKMIDRKININPAIRKICKGAGKNTNAPKAKKRQVPDNALHPNRSAGKLYLL